MEAHIVYQDEPKHKNGEGRKRVRTPVGNVEISTPRDRNGTFYPDIIRKSQQTLCVDLNRQIIDLYARGTSYSDIQDHLSECITSRISK